MTRCNERPLLSGIAAALGDSPPDAVEPVVNGQEADVVGSFAAGSRRGGGASRWGGGAFRRSVRVKIDNASAEGASSASVPVCRLMTKPRRRP